LRCWTGITTGRVAGASINTGRVVDARDSQECDVRSQEYSTLEKPVLTKIVRVLRVAYDPTEFTPLVLHFINELAPPMTEKRFVYCVFSHEWGGGGNTSLLVFTDYKICVHGIQRCAKRDSVISHWIEENEGEPLRCTSDAKNSKKDMILISHVRFFSSLLVKIG